MKDNELKMACEWFSVDKDPMYCVIDEWNVSIITDCNSCPFYANYMTRDEFEAFKKKMIETLQK